MDSPARARCERRAAVFGSLRTLCWFTTLGGMEWASGILLAPVETVPTERVLPNRLWHLESSRRNDEAKGAGVSITQFELAGNSLIGHLAQWPAGRYHKAHYHGPGAILLGLQSCGYVLLWSKELGTRPYEDGHGEDVVEVKWKAGSIYCPPGGWFHQHFNTGSQPARHLAQFGVLLASPFERALVCASCSPRPASDSRRASASGIGPCRSSAP